MNWLLAVACVIAAGLAAGQLKVRGVSLGVAGVLFAGLVAGHFGLARDGAPLDTLRDLGLVLFVSAVGAQVGPGFIDSLRRGGLRLNGLAAAIVLLGAACALALARVFDVDVYAMAGVFAGATTNTPSLGAAQQALDGLPDVSAARRGLPGLGYAVAYPFGVIGVLLAIVGVRAAFRIDVAAEVAHAEAARRGHGVPVARRAFVITNENLDGMTVEALPGLRELRVVVSRVLEKGARDPVAATAARVVHVGDTVLVVGAGDALDKAGAILGKPTELDLTIGGATTSARVVVTRKAAVGQAIDELALEARFGVTVTRLRRGDVELVARPSMHVRFGDLLSVVGRPEDVRAAADAVGNSEKALGLTDFLPIFCGIALGVLLGSIAVPLPGLPAPVKLGLAGGPLLVAIVLGRIGKVGPLVFHLPGNVNLALRELGIALFLSAVGIKAGAHLGDALAGDGLVWLACGVVITLVPLGVVAVCARLVFKLDFGALAGLLAGAMTDPPALAFANGLVGADAAALSYAAVYPTTMVLRILAAQALILWFGASP